MLPKIMKTKPLRLCCVTNQNSMHIAQFYCHSGVSLRGINDIAELDSVMFFAHANISAKLRSDEKILQHMS